jgi:hypothetical protein
MRSPSAPVHLSVYPHLIFCSYEAYDIALLSVCPPPLIFSSSVQSVSCQRKVGDYFFPEFFFSFRSAYTSLFL